MKFGKTWDEVNAEPQGGTGNGFMRWFKDGDTTFRVIQEPQDWVGYWEHFNPGGFPFPCTGERKTCPGCTSTNDKMNKASRKIAVQVLEGEYVNVYKFPKTLADKLANRAERAKPTPTVTDRDWVITKYKSGDRVDYDLEGLEKTPVDLSKIEYKDVEAMLQEAYDNAWGDSSKAQATKDGNEFDNAQAELKAKLAKQDAAQEEKPPFDSPSAETEEVNNEYNEQDLRKMSKGQLYKVLNSEKLSTPEGWEQMSIDEVVDWLLEQ